MAGEFSNANTDLTLNCKDVCFFCFRGRNETLEETEFGNFSLRNLSSFLELDQGKMFRVNGSADVNDKLKTSQVVVPVCLECQAITQEFQGLYSRLNSCTQRICSVIKESETNSLKRMAKRGLVSEENILQHGLWTEIVHKGSLKNEAVAGTSAPSNVQMEETLPVQHKLIQETTSGVGDEPYSDDEKEESSQPETQVADGDEGNHTNLNEYGDNNNERSSESSEDAGRTPSNSGIAFEEDGEFNDTFYLQQQFEQSPLTINRVASLTPILAQKYSYCPYAPCKARFLANIKKDSKSLQFHYTTMHLDRHFVNLRKENCPEPKYKEIIFNLLFQDFITDHNLCIFCKTARGSTKSEKEIYMRSHMINYHFNVLAKRLEELQDDPETDAKLETFKSGRHCSCGMYLKTKSLFNVHERYHCPLKETEVLKRRETRRKSVVAMGSSLVATPIRRLSLPTTRLRSYDESRQGRKRRKVNYDESAIFDTSANLSEEHYLFNIKMGLENDDDDNDETMSEQQDVFADAHGCNITDVKNEF